MERRNFVKNLAALLAISGIDPTKAISDISDISDQELDDLEMILKYDGNEMRSKILNGQINIHQNEIISDGDGGVEVLYGSKSWDMDIELKYLSGLRDSSYSGCKAEIIIKLKGKNYSGQGFITSYIEYNTGLMELGFMGSGPLTTW